MVLIVTIPDSHARFRAHDPELSAIYVVEIVLKGWYFTALLAFPETHGAPGPWLCPFSFSRAGWSWFSFLAHRLQRDLGKEQRLKNKPVSFSTFE